MVYAHVIVLLGVVQYDMMYEALLQRRVSPDAPGIEPGCPKEGVLRCIFA